VRSTDQSVLLGTEGQSSRRYGRQSLQSYADKTVFGVLTCAVAFVADWTRFNDIGGRSVHGKGKTRETKNNENDDDSERVTLGDESARGRRARRKTTTPHERDSRETRMFRRVSSVRVRCGARRSRAQTTATSADEETSPGLSRRGRSIFFAVRQGRFVGRRAGGAGLRGIDCPTDPTTVGGDARAECVRLACRGDIDFPSPYHKAGVTNWRNAIYNSGIRIQ